MPPEMTLEGMIPTLRELSAELFPIAFRRVLAGDRGDPQTEEGATYAGPFGADYADLDPARTRADLLRQVRLRLHVLDASLDEPEDGDAVRLDAADGPLWLTAVEPL